MISEDDNKMLEQEIKKNEQKADTLEKPLKRFLLGTAVLYSLWFFGALYFVILI